MDCLARVMAILQGMPVEKLRLLLRFAEFLKTQQPKLPPLPELKRLSKD